MNMTRITKNLEHDIGNGGVKDDTHAANCYIIAATVARRTLRDDAESGFVDDEEASDDARAFLAICAKSGCAGLESVVRN